MAPQTDREPVSMDELLMSNTIQIDALYQLLIQKGYFTEGEFLSKLKEVQMDYKSLSTVH